SGALNDLGSMYFKQKNYDKAKAIFAAALKKFPQDLDLLSNDLELSLVQKDRVRFQKRLNVLLRVLKPENNRYIVVSFLSYLENTQQGYQSVIETIEKDKEFRLGWEFSTLQLAIQRQDPKTQKIAHLFIDFFEERLDLKTLKTRLAELEKQRP
ncbi:MAG: tetratricopeptide repeat protein, partial [Methylococcales bacterium]